MTGLNPIGFVPVFHFHEVQESISKTEKCRLPDENYKKTGEFSNCESRLRNPQLIRIVDWSGEIHNGQAV